MSGKPVLLVKTHAFGDCLMVTPAAAALAAGGAECWALAGPSTREVWERLPGIRRVLTAPFPPRRSPAGWASLAAWSLGARKVLHRVGTAVVFHPSAGVRRWVRALTASPARSGGESPIGAWETCVPFGRGGYAGRLYADIAGVEPASYRPLFAVREDEAAWAAGELGGARWVAVAPGGASNPRDEVAEKRWPAEEFADLCRLILSRGFGVALVGDSRDSAAAAVVRGRLDAGPGRLRDYTGRLGWGKTAAVISSCRAFVGIDSGPAHLASACGVPPVVLFGPTAPRSLYYEGEVVPVISPAECSPCYSNEVFPGCGKGRADCTGLIKAAAAWPPLERILG